jgi:hypothetical protein
MKPFAVKLKDGSTLLGLGLSADEIRDLSAGQELVVDLESTGMGLWTKEAEGRSFVQPRDSKVVLIAGDSNDSISKFLGIKLP